MENWHKAKVATLLSTLLGRMAIQGHFGGDPTAVAKAMTDELWENYGFVLNRVFPRPQHYFVAMLAVSHFFIKCYASRDGKGLAFMMNSFADLDGAIQAQSKHARVSPNATDVAILQKYIIPIRLALSNGDDHKLEEVLRALADLGDRNARALMRSQASVHPAPSLESVGSVIGSIFLVMIILGIVTLAVLIGREIYRNKNPSHYPTTPIVDRTENQEPSLPSSAQPSLSLPDRQPAAPENHASIPTPSLNPASLGFKEAYSIEPTGLFLSEAQEGSPYTQIPSLTQLYVNPADPSQVLTKNTLGDLVTVFVDPEKIVIGSLLEASEVNKYHKNLATLPKQGAQSPGSLPLSHTNIAATILKSSGLDSSEAVVEGEVTWMDAMEYCLRDPGAETNGTASSILSCAERELASNEGIAYMIKANCETWEISTANLGDFMHSPTEDPAEDPWLNVETNERIGGGRGQTVDAQFFVACPNNQ